MADEYNIYIVCPHCKGTGEVPDYPTDTYQPPTGTKTCPECDGSGKKLFAWTETTTE